MGGEARSPIHWSPFRDTLLENLAEQGWSMIEGIFSEEFIHGLREEARRLWQQGAFRQAQIGRGQSRQRRPEIRSDAILWLHPEQLTPLQQTYWQFIDTLRQEFNREFFLNLREFEAHLAVYPPGAYYRRHLDQFKTAPERLITCILYLNRDWQPEEGGQLRIYLDAACQHYRDVLPRGGTFVCFRSDRIYHEVLPAQRERYSLTGWLKRASFPL